MRRLSLLVLSLTLALPAAAQVYQWRDAQGRINYSDSPPPCRSGEDRQAREPAQGAGGR